MQVINEARGHSKEMPTSRMSGLRSIVTLDPLNAAAVMVGQQEPTSSQRGEDAIFKWSGWPWENQWYSASTIAAIWAGGIS
jgi:hypothetical protein